MTRTDNAVDELADLYAFLSRVLADSPDEAAVSRLANERFPTEASPQALETGFGLLKEWQSGVRDPADAAEDLRKIHTRLVVGPRPKLQIYESWYADDYLGKPLAAVKASYRDLGIQPSADLREEGDHAAVELAALEMLVRASDDEHRRAFLLAHGWWLPELADDIRERADDPFYEAVSWLIEGTFQVDTYLLGLDPTDLSPGYDRVPSVRANE